MQSEMMAKLRKSLIKHERLTYFPYTDTVGKLTIGIGHNLTDCGLSDNAINAQFLDDVNYFYTQLTTTFDWYIKLNEDRQIILIDMCFMGWKTFLEFTRLITALSKFDYDHAAFEMINSEWAKQVKSRADDLAKGMLSGVYNP
jgi:lysozyme